MQVSTLRRAGRAFFSSPRVWLVLVLLLAWGMRLYHLGTMSVWWDESLSWDRAIGTIPTILANLITIQTTATRDLHPPLYFLLLHFVVLAAGTTEFALRFLSSVAGLLTIAALYPLARILFGARGRIIGLLTVLFATLSPLYVWYSQEARPYGLVLLWSVLALYALLRWLKTKPATPRALFSRWAIVFGVLLIANLVTLYLAFVLLPFFAVTVWLLNGNAPTWRERIKTLPTLVAGLLLVLFVAILIFLPRTGDVTSSEEVPTAVIPLFIMLRDVWNSYVVGVTASLDQSGPLDAFLLVLWLVGIFSTIRAKKRDARLALFFLSYILVPTFAVQLGSYVRPLYLNSRHLILTSPAFYFGIALGVDALARRISSFGQRTTPSSVVGRRSSVIFRPSSFVAGLVTILAALPIIAGALFSLNNLYDANPTFAKDNHKAWAEFLKERLRPDDYLIVDAPQAEKIVGFYAPAGLQWESLPHLGQTKDWQIFLDRQSVLNAYRNHGRVWFLELHEPVADPKFGINNLLRRYGDPTDITYFPAIASQIVLTQFIYRGVAQPADVAIAHPTQILFGDHLNLLGYDAPASIEPGSRGAVQLYWKLDKKSQNDISASLRVVDAQGKLWGQWDAPPIGNLFPISEWDAKTIYLDGHDFVVQAGTPPGNYFIELNVYHVGTNEPLTITLPDGTQSIDPIRLASIAVTRPTPPLDPKTLIMDGHADASLGSALRFVGYDMEDNNANPGSAIPVTLYFQVTQSSAPQINGHVQLIAPWYEFWNQARADTPFSLDLTNRQAGEIVQAQVQVRVPGETNAGAHDLQVSLDNTGGALTIATVNVENIARSNDLPPITKPMNARLGDSIEFLGYDLDSRPTLNPKDTVKLKLYWRALKPIDTSYKVFTHLLGEDNQVRGQQDKFPLDGARPTSSWAPGEIFTDSYAINVDPNAPSGSYQIEIGMYNPDTSTRLPTFDANGASTGDRILFGELRVR
jgi:Dolichyl-phosphate-mannose-protein mannosyltransferase